MPNKIFTVLAIISSGIFYAVSQPKYSIFPLSFFIFLPLYLATKGKSLKETFLVWFLGGLLAWLLTINWVTVAITVYGGLPYPIAFAGLVLLSGYLSLYFGIFGVLRKQIALPGFIKDPVIWTALELIKTHLGGGFPWALLGYSLWKVKPLIQIVDITGVYGLSFLVAMIAGFLCDLTERKPRSVVVGVLTISFVLSSMLIYARGKDKFAGNRDLGIVIVQGNIPQDVKWTERMKEESLRVHFELTDKALKFVEAEDILAVWPETALTFYPQVERKYLNKLTRYASSKGIGILAGALGYNTEGDKMSFFNRAYLFEGSIRDYYDKMHLVPFGEFLPLRAQLEKIPFVKKLIDRIEKVSGDFKAGKRLTIFDFRRMKFSVIICYEAIFPAQVSEFLKRGAQFIVNITNDAWFGKTSAPYQHFAMATIRAVENRVYLVRSANTGISGIVAPDGSVVVETDIFTREFIWGQIRTSTHKTFYTKYGDVFAWINLVLFVTFIGWRLFQKLRS